MPVESARIHFCGRFDPAGRFLYLVKTVAGQRQHFIWIAVFPLRRCVWKRVRLVARKLSLQPPIERRQTPEPARGEDKKVARPPRFERGTLCLEGRCSIQLSYGRSPDSKRFRASATIHLLLPIKWSGPYFETVSWSEIELNRVERNWRQGDAPHRRAQLIRLRGLERAWLGAIMGLIAVIHH